LQRRFSGLFPDIADALTLYEEDDIYQLTHIIPYPGAKYNYLCEPISEERPFPDLLKA
jgi:hypothetical protein